MDNEQIKSMDGFMLLSIINMKLRDKYGSLDELCDDMYISTEILQERLLSVGYKYNEETNQFVSYR